MNVELTQADLNALAAAAKVLSALAGQADAPTATPKAPRKARKAAAQPKADVKCVVKSNREAVVRANPALVGLSTLDIAIAVVHLGFTLKGYTIGERYTERAQAATKGAIAQVKAHLA